MIFDVTEEAREQLAHGQRRDASKVKRIKSLLTAIRDDHPFDGIGKPEPLRFALTGQGSRASVSQGLDGVRKAPSNGFVVKHPS